MTCSLDLVPRVEGCLVFGCEIIRDGSATTIFCLPAQGMDFPCQSVRPCLAATRGGGVSEQSLLTVPINISSYLPMVETNAPSCISIDNVDECPTWMDVGITGFQRS